jgi:hypothetical protein
MSSDFYFEDCNEFFEEKFAKYPDLLDMKRFVQSLPVSVPNGIPSTWRRTEARDKFDIVGNWLHKELYRCGVSGKSAKKQDSARRCQLYADRRQLIPHSKALREEKIQHTVCPLSGHPLNFGLGLTKDLLSIFFYLEERSPTISPSLERIDPNLSYTFDNVEIISVLENIRRNNITCSDTSIQRILEAINVTNDI